MQFKIFDKRVLATLSGNIMEFYDFIIYAFLSPYISKLFFPVEDKLVSFIITFGVFASGYLVRPIGAIFFGYVGDKYGRKPALIYSITFITVATILIGLLPTYSSIGVFAPILLIVCRLLQGFAVSGEQSGAVVYLVEVFANKKNGLLGALTLGSSYFGVLIGSLTCLLLTSFISEVQLLMFGWRIPFISSIFLGVFSLYLRVYAAESTDYMAIKEQYNKQMFNPVKQVFNKQSLQMLVQIFMVAALAIPVYMYTVFLPSYLTAIMGFSIQASLKISVLSLVFLSIGVPVFGSLSDRIGYKKMFCMGCCALILMAYPIFQFFTQTNQIMIFCGLVLLGGSIFLIAGPIFAILVDSFATQVRFTGVSVVFNTSMTIFGSTTPMLNFFLIKVFANNAAPWIYIVCAGIIGICSLAYLHRQDFIEHELQLSRA